MARGRPEAQGGVMDSILAQWRRERPDIDPSVMAVCGDLWRAADRVRDGVAANLTADDLDLAGFDVLLTLRRQGRGSALSPSELAQDMMISTSAMTNRLDRLQKRGLIERLADPQDRRALRVVLTEAGFALAERIVVSHVATEERLVSALSPDERAELRRLLAKIG
ncbi:MarR family transcriptional regulator [Bosea sp. AS-1]|uniref:MarR family winged helix-turn-helix transcriptional regulator n=1 Tax=Bosea sp. AS-1 TaxID=2015316 RepID=UPI0018DF5BF8|nr:MarR family transcriptional regulator [Bosea sp. AS-1]